MLAPLRRDLEIMPSPIEDQPGVLIRDPMRYSDLMIVIPWSLARALECFDGNHNELDLREVLVRETGQLSVGDVQNHLIEALQGGAFLEDEVFERQRQERHRAFAGEEVLPASHAGSAYPIERELLDQTMLGYLDPAQISASNGSGFLGIAAPHVSPFGGWKSYQAAYRKLPRDAAGRTFVVLGTSHYGEPDKFGLTRKDFVTPLGQARTDRDLVNRLVKNASSGIVEEDYCYSVEHSIEFQVLFLQWLFGPEVSIVPILCGSFARSIYFGGKPEKDDGVERVLGELAEIAEKERDRLAWVLGIDMAHIGSRYGDSDPAHADAGRMVEVAEQDRARNARVTAGDAEGFWALVQQNRDELRWCGASPLYTFLKAIPGLRGNVERYEQWNIDEASVVSFAGISFSRTPDSPAR